MCRIGLALLSVAGAGLLDDPGAVAPTTADATAVVVAGALVERAAEASTDADVSHSASIVLSHHGAGESDD